VPPCSACRADQHRGHLGAAAALAQGEPDRAGEGQCGVVDVDAELVEQCAELVEHVGDRGFEQLGLAGEVVVERAKADVGGVRDLLDAGLRGSVASQHRPCGGDEFVASLSLAPLDPAAWEGTAGSGLGS
jgi:hypothetical protein